MHNYFQSAAAGEISSIRCIQREREALLTFKKSLTDDRGHLSSWGSDDDCCRWKGVGCSNSTGHVTALLLQVRDNYHPYGFGGKISSALLELHHLNSLDLSDNDFGWSRIPKFIGSIKSLQHLKLSNCNFYGIIPHELGNLTNLRRLDLSVNDIWSENLHWLSHLSSITHLSLSSAKISDAIWLQRVLGLSTLQELDMGGCVITHVKLSAPHFVNSSATSLSFLDLAENGLATSSIFLDFLFNVSTNFVEIHLFYNQIQGSIPDDLGKLIFLRHLDLSHNKLEGRIPKSLGSSSFLDYLDLSDNNLEDGIPESLGNLTYLEYVDLSTNMLEGGIPKFLGNLSRLQYLLLSRNDLRESLDGLFGNQCCRVMVSLDLSFNQLTGSMPDLGACLPRLRDLYLDNNKLTGQVPASIGQLSKLENLDLSFNSLEGTISEAHFMKLHHLTKLDLSFNSFIFNSIPDWVPPFQLSYISLSRCKIGPSFPTWLQTQRSVMWLDLSSNGISEKVPTWFLKNLPVSYLNLSYNQISGTIPNLYYLEVIDVSYNNFSGPIPVFHLNTSAVQLSHNKFSGSISFVCTNSSFSLMLLYLSNNQLEGALPNCWGSMTHLRILNLNNNNFSGGIPHSLGSLCILQTLHLRGNNLSGKLPSTLRNFLDLQLMDIGSNKISGNIPPWLGLTNPMMVYLSLSDNRFSGGIPPEICHLTRIQMLDLSGNNISGKIPRCFNNFTLLAEKNTTVSTTIVFPTSGNNYIDYALVQWKGQESEYRNTLELLKLIDLSSNKLVGNVPKAFSSMRGLVSLNLSRNNLTGNIDPSIGEMEMLECLDLSRNRLSGEIPIGLAQVHYLAILDLANNNLFGKIPSGTQLQSFNESAYAGNSKLCGLPLALCAEDRVKPSTNDEGEDIKEKDIDGFMGLSLMQGLGISMAFGFIVGFWGVVGSLLLKTSWRSSYFNFLDAIGDRLYVTTTIFFGKFRRG